MVLLMVALSVKLRNLHFCCMLYLMMIELFLTFKCRRSSPPPAPLQHSDLFALSAVLMPVKLPSPALVQHSVCFLMILLF